MLLVVGGHSRNLGKTSLVAGLIREFREFSWTALKITQYGHSVCSDHGDTCECDPGAGERISLTEEYEPSTTDSGRFLAAGAERSFWLRAPAGALTDSASLIKKIIAQSENIIVESNSILELVQPDLFLMLLDFGCSDFKSSSLRFLSRADAFVVADRSIADPTWPNVPVSFWRSKPHFPIVPPRYVTPAVTDFVKLQFSAASR